MQVLRKVTRMFARFFSGASQPPSDQVRFVDAATARRWLEAGEAVLVDVREPPEHAAERIEGALFHPLSGFDPARLPAPDGRKLVLHCRSGVRCGMAADRLLQAGYAGPIHRLEGGILGWKAAGNPTVAGG